MVGQPRIGDAFGEIMRAALAEHTGQGPRPTIGGRIPRSVIEIVERDDGMINGAPAARYLSGPDEWQPFDLRALELLDAPTLDIGAGAGRLSLALQDRGVPVTALDISPGAVEVAAARGVRQTVCATVAQHVASGLRYDRFALFGNNVGLLGSKQSAPRFLDALAAMSQPGARIVAQGTDPYRGTDELHLAYHARNRAAGRMGGELRVRVRYRNLAPEWFDYLLCTPEELAGLTRSTAWRVENVDDADAPFYVATLALA
jgi:SAM-dependent methyltransferase